MIPAAPRSTVLRDGLILLVTALILRAATFGDPNVYIDEAFYVLVGQAMHHGAVPYIDIWDRKPLGLFALYWAIAGVSTNVLAYQLVATVAAAATALILAQIARRWVGGMAPLMAGIAYLFYLHPLLGMGGQSPVFYNVLIAGAALLLVGGWTGAGVAEFRRRYFGAMALCGLALTIKQTTLFEGIWFGLIGMFWLHRKQQTLGQIARDAGIAIVIALLPMTLIGSWYAAHGWWPQWWNSMVTSNFRRGGLGEIAVRHNAIAVTLLLAVYVGVAAIGLAGQRHAGQFNAYRTLVLGWLAAAVVGFLAVPNFIDHYALPLLVPMTPLAALAFSRPLLGPVLLGMTALIAVILGRPFDFAYHRASAASFAEMVKVIEQYRGDRSLVLLSGPVLLYPATHSPPPTALVFPGHLTNSVEVGVSYLNTRTELQRIASARPSVIVMHAETPPPVPDDPLKPVMQYIAADCQVVWRGLVYEPRTIKVPVLIYSCR